MNVRQCFPALQHMRARDFWSSLLVSCCCPGPPSCASSEESESSGGGEEEAWGTPESAPYLQLPVLTPSPPPLVHPPQHQLTLYCISSFSALSFVSKTPCVLLINQFGTGLERWFGRVAGLTPVEETIVNLRKKLGDKFRQCVTKSCDKVSVLLTHMFYSVLLFQQKAFFRPALCFNFGSFLPSAK